MCNYTALIHHEDGPYWAEFPAFPGCYSSGATLDEVKGDKHAMHMTLVGFMDYESV